MIAAALAALASMGPGLAAGLAALAATALTLAALAIKRVFSPKPPTVADVATAQAGQVVAVEQAAVSKAEAKTITAVAQAFADAPTTQAAVVDSLNKGEF